MLVPVYEGAFVSCLDCNTETERFGDYGGISAEDRAIAAWNRRTPDPRVEKLVKAAEGIEVKRGDMPCKPHCGNHGGYGRCSCAMEAKRDAFTAALAAFKEQTK